MIAWLKKDRWPWWQAGILLGLLNAAVFYTSNYYLSASTTFSRAAGMVVGLFAAEHVAANPYWQKVKPVVDWQFMLVLGLPLGAYLAARLAGPVKVTAAAPSLWQARFGGVGAGRWVVGLLGGVLVGFGARLADGCTSGHALSGSTQLAVSGWLFFAAMLGSGATAGRLLFGGRQ